MMVLLDSFQIFFGFQPFSCHCARCSALGSEVQGHSQKQSKTYLENSLWRSHCRGPLFLRWRWGCSCKTLSFGSTPTTRPNHRGSALRHTGSNTFRNILKKKFEKLFLHFLLYARAVTGNCSLTCKRCILAEDNLTQNKYEGVLLSKQGSLKGDSKQTDGGSIVLPWLVH